MRIRHITTIIICLLVPSYLLAAVFTPPPTDRSLGLLGIIFGDSIGSTYLGGQPSDTLSSMFELFNVTVVTIGSIIVSYIFIVSTINTAQEGKTMGKKYASLWIPLRSMLGMMMLVPTPGSGFSIIQGLVIWFITQGIGAADNIWNMILDNLSQGQSPTSVVHIAESRESQALEDIGDLLGPNIVNAAVTATSLKYLNFVQDKEKSEFVRKQARRIKFFSEASGNNPKSNLILANANTVTYTGTSFIGIKDNDGLKDLCGRFDISGTAYLSDWDPDDRANVTNAQLYNRAKRIYETKTKAIERMYKVSTGLAQAIVTERIRPRGNDGRVMENVQLLPGGARLSLKTAYSATLSSLTKEKNPNWLDNAVNEGKKNGWVSAASYYYILNRAKNSLLMKDATDNPPIAGNIPECSAKNCRYGSGNNKSLKRFDNILSFGHEKDFVANHLWDANRYYKQDKFVVQRQLDLGRNDLTNEEFMQEQVKALNSISRFANQDQETQAEFIRKILELKNEAVNVLIAELHNIEDDPLLGHARLGANIVAYAEQAMGALLSRGNQLLYGDADTDDLESSFYEIVVQSIIGVSLVSMLWAAGMALAIYVPFIPFIIFTVASLGWMLLVIESVVAAPLLAIAFILPGQGDELGKIGQGMMLLFNILLRPILMLFGFILATRLYRAVIHLINFGIVNNFRSIDTPESILAIIPAAVMYSVFVVSLANKTFALIYALPDKILRWMGSPAEHSDASQEMHAIKGGVQKAASTIEKPAAGFAIGQMSNLKGRWDEIKDRLAGDTVTHGVDSSEQPPDNNQQ